MLSLTPSILASAVPPLWMIQNRLWMFFSVTMIFYFILFMISPWFFLIGWTLKSWYVGINQIEILRFFYKFNNYRLWMSICEETDKRAQELSRSYDDKIDFDFSYLDPPILEEETESV